MALAENRFSKGFNSGYILSKYQPNLLATVLKGIQPTNDFLAGLFFGKREYEIENAKLQIEDLKQVRKKSKELGLDFERNA